jgi:hypothetical protein
LIHRRVANSLADAQGCAMHTIGAAFDGRNRIDQTQAAILMAMPVYPNVFPLLGDYFTDKSGDGTSPLRSCVPDGIGNS